MEARRLVVVLLAEAALLFAPNARATLVCTDQSTSLARPVPMGTSIGDVYAIGTEVVSGVTRTVCTAGTAGAVAIDNNGNTVILTNNHIGAFNYAPWSYIGNS